MRVLAWFPVVLAVVGSATYAIAQSTTADQGRPGREGPWPVTIPGPVQVVVDGGTVTIVSADGGTPTFDTQAVPCVTPVHSDTNVGLAAAPCPAAQLSGRKSIVICNSLENPGNARLVKVRVDGTNPVMGLGNPGDVLGAGDCVVYTIPASIAPKCISNLANTHVHSLECL